MEFKFHLGKACNLRCSYCRIHKHDEPYEDYTDVLYDELDDVLNRGIRVTKLLLTGGEPTLYHDQVMRIINKYNDKVDKISIVSNGTNVDRCVEYLKYSNVKLSISWDGHENGRGYDAYNSIKALIDSGVNVSICYVVSNDNYSHIYDDLLELEKINLSLPSAVELLIVAAKRNYYKFDYSVIKDQLKKIYKKWSNLDIFKSNKSKRCPHVYSQDTLTEIIDGKIYRGCINYAYDKCGDESAKLNCADKNYNKCLTCDNEYCHTCSNRLLKTIYDGIYSVDIDKDSKYWDSVPRCKIYRIVKEVVEESRRTQFLLSKLRKVERLELLISNDCNLACTYCVENGCKGNKDMTKDVIDNIVAYLSTLKLDGAKIPDIMLFGGEPLLPRNITLLNYLLDQLLKYEINAKFEIFTNGYDFTEDVKNFLIRLDRETKLPFIQVSLDCVKDVNDTRRPARDGKGSFEQVLNNIYWLSKQFGGKRVIINSVMDYNNISKVVDWVKWTNDKLVAPGIIRACDIKLDQVRDTPLSHLQMYELKDMYRKITSMFVNGEITKTAFISTFEMFNVRCDVSLNVKDPGCGMCDSFVAVTPIGEIIPCHSVMNNESMILGKFDNGALIATQNVYTIYDTFSCSGEFRVHGKECYTCEGYDTCSKCKGVEFLKHGNPRELNTLKCQINMMRLDVLREFGITLRHFKKLSNEELVEFKKELKELQDIYDDEKDNMTSDELKLIETEIIKLVSIINPCS